MRVVRSFGVLICCATAATATERQAPQATPTAAAPAAATTTAPPTLQSLLASIADHTKLRIVVDEAIAEQPVTAPLDRPVDEVIRTVLAPYDVFYLHSNDAKGAATLKAIWVYARGEAADIAPVPATAWATTKDFEAQLQSSNADVRLRAFVALINRLGEDAMPILERALRDPEASVRAGALAAALDAGPDLSAAELMRMLSDDPSPEVRVLALDAAEARDDAAAIANVAAADGDPRVRARAKELMGEATPPPPLANDPQAAALAAASQAAAAPKKPGGR